MRAQAEFGGAAQDGGVFVADAFDAQRLAGAGSFERIARGGGYFARFRRNRIAVRIRRWVAEHLGDAVFEFLADGVFEAICFGVHLIPAEAHGFDEVELDQAMMANDFQCDLFAGVGELRTLVGDVFDEVEFGELFEHAGDGGGLDAQACGDGSRGGTAVLAAHLIDGFEIVLN